MNFQAGACKERRVSVAILRPQSLPISPLQNIPTVSFYIRAHIIDSSSSWNPVRATRTELWICPKGARDSSGLLLRNLA